jgi:hypothetical protein
MITAEIERLNARVAELNTSYAHIFRENELLRAQHEALMALPDALRNTLRMLEAAHRQLGMYTKDNPRIVKARAALIEAQRANRAAGIHEGEGK